MCSPPTVGPAVSGFDLDCCRRAFASPWEWSRRTAVAAGGGSCVSSSKARRTLPSAPGHLTSPEPAERRQADLPPRRWVPLGQGLDRPEPPCPAAPSRCWSPSAPGAVPESHRRPRAEAGSLFSPPRLDVLGKRSVCQQGGSGPVSLLHLFLDCRDTRAGSSAAIEGTSCLGRDCRPRSLPQLGTCYLRAEGGLVCTCVLQRPLTSSCPQLDRNY